LHFTKVIAELHEHRTEWGTCSSQVKYSPHEQLICSALEYSLAKVEHITLKLIP